MGRFVKKGRRITPRYKKAAARSRVARSNVVASRRKSLKRIVKDVVMKTTETKQKILATTIVGNWSGAPSPLNKGCHNFHTVEYLWQDGGTLALWPTAGTSDAGRVGDNVNALGIHLRAVLQIPHDRRNMRCKMYFVQWNTSQGDPYDRSLFYHWTMQNTHMDAVNKDNFASVRYLGTYGCRSVDQTTGSQDKTIMIRKWLPFKKKLTFRGSIGQPTNCKENGAIIFVPYDTVTALESDVLITRIQMTASLYFKDP